METGLGKSARTEGALSGVFIGLVKRVDSDAKKAWVQIGRLTGPKTIGPLSIVGPLPDVGHRVACMFMENGELLIMGVLQQVASAGPVTGGMIVAPEPPGATQEGQQWYDTTTAQEYVALDNGTGSLVWVQSGGAGPAGPSGPTGPAGPSGSPGADASGDVVGPVSSVGNSVARFHLGTGKIIKSSGVTINDTGYLTATGVASQVGYSIGNSAHVLREEDSDSVILETSTGGYFIVAPGGLASEASQLNLNGALVYGTRRSDVATAQTTTSAALVDLTTVHSLSMTTGTLVRILFGAVMRTTVGSGGMNMTIAVSGATTLPGGTSVSIADTNNGSNAYVTHNSSTATLKTREIVVALNAGVNVFTAKHYVGSSTTGEFSNRFMVVERLD